MMTSRPQISVFDELIVDNFAGGGGASTGIELAAGRVVDIAINHDSDAILMHRTNHPYTRHYQASVWDIDPVEVCAGQPVGLAWFSPDCKHFSKAKGGKPVNKEIRGLAWITLRWAGTVRPRVIILENVEEFQTWGPVRRGKPVKSKKGQTFDKFIAQLRSLGYTVEWRELYRANGFPDDYIIDRDYEGNEYGTTKQVARCGNAVPSHQGKAMSLAVEELGKTEEEIADMCPKEFYFDYLTWLLSLTGSAAVWSTLIMAPSLTKAQVATLRRLKMAGLLKASIPNNEEAL